MSSWSRMLLAVSLGVVFAHPTAVAEIAWPETLYNPRPLADDPILPLPCGGALALRSVPTPPRDRGYAVTGAFEQADGIPLLLLGKYELTQLQARAIRADAEGKPCPTADATAALPFAGGWWEAVELADRYSLWLAAHAEEIPACGMGVGPCLPRVDGVPAYVRLPTAAEWEYAARGGLSVTAEQFAAPRYPMRGGLAAHAWYRANAQGRLQPIGGLAANPLALHDLYGNAAEWVLDALAQGSERPDTQSAAIALGGDAGSGDRDLAATRGRTHPPYAATVLSTGLRLAAGVPIFTSLEKVREAERRRLAETDGIPPPPPPVRFLAKLRASVDAPAQVLVDGQVVGEAKPGQPLERQDIEVGRRQIAIKADGYAAETQTYRLRTGQWTEVWFRVDPTTPDMAGIAGGCFQMGSPEREPERHSDERRHWVCLDDAFAIGKREVTFAEYDGFARATGRVLPNDRGWGRDRHPVIDVSWQDATDYAEWLSGRTGRRYRLPTEAEWEFAARAGTAAPFWSGECIHPEQANYNGSARFEGCSGETGLFKEETLPVGTLTPNLWGLYDMAGNVWEWTCSAYDRAYAGAERGCLTRPSAGSPIAVRGGSWESRPGELRSASRRSLPVSTTIAVVGFRLAGPLSVSQSTPSSHAWRAIQEEQWLGLTAAQRRDVRTWLKILALDGEEGDGNFTAKTREAIAAFQQREGLDESGYLDARTVEKLKARVEAERQAARRRALGVPEMVSIRAGCFQMGSPASEPQRFSDEGPQHKVCLKAFEIGKTEVTFTQYDAFAEATGRKKPGDEGWGRGNLPVIHVGWEDAVAYAHWLSELTGQTYRLPSEAEWEYAARAGTETPFWTGRCINGDQANYDGRYDYNSCGAKTGVFRGKTVPVGSSPANPWGLHDVHGNVWEWVQDRWHRNYKGAPADGSAWDRGDASARVLRGASWENVPWGLRSACRSRGSLGLRDGDTGFRLARTLRR